MLVIGLVVLPAIALISLGDSRGSAAFAFTAVGLALAVIGAVGVSRFLAEPNYDVILSWDGHTPSPAVELARRRYFLWNWVRGVLVWSAFGCFVVAIYLDWR